MTFSPDAWLSTRPVDGYFAVEAVLPAEIFVRSNTLDNPAPEAGTRLFVTGPDGLVAQFDMEPQTAQYVERRLQYDPAIETRSESFTAEDTPCWPDAL